MAGYPTIWKAVMVDNDANEFIVSPAEYTTKCVGLETAIKRINEWARLKAMGSDHIGYNLYMKNSKTDGKWVHLAFQKFEY